MKRHHKENLYVVVFAAVALGVVAYLVGQFFSELWKWHKATSLTTRI